MSLEQQKENGEITGFFIKERDQQPFFVSYDKFIELIKQKQIQELYWDNCLNSIGVETKNIDTLDTTEKVTKRVKKAMEKVPAITDFNTFIHRDAIFNYSGEHNVIPAAVLLISRTFFMDVVTIAMPYTKEVKQLHHSIEKYLPEYKDLFVLNAGGLVLRITVNLMEEVFGRIGDMGYHVVLCMETVRNAIEDGYLYKAMSRLTKPVSEKVLSNVETIITQLNYKASVQAFRQARKERSCSIYGNS